MWWSMPAGRCVHVFIISSSTRISPIIGNSLYAEAILLAGHQYVALLLRFTHVALITEPFMLFTP